MFKWMSQKGKNVWRYIFWFYIFSYIPVIPAYFIMSLKGLLGLSSLIYVAFSLFVIYKLYIRFELDNNTKKSALHA
jgi:hypothetical protein